MASPPIERLKPEDFLRLIEKSRLGKLKIYLGHAAGVGKTYAMLEEAHRLKTAGVDVVIGWVETHGRQDTGSKCLMLNPSSNATRPFASWTNCRLPTSPVHRIPNGISKSMTCCSRASTSSRR
jgi:K+-sensing histidine kinase KdpD